MAGDHGEVYKREQRRWTVGGAIVGAAVGTYVALTFPCHAVPYGPRSNEEL
jgi:hypothetical protein